MPEPEITRWSEKQAHDWYANMPWQVGCNYLPRHAINQLEMWQAETFNPAQIQQELSWAQKLGFNTLRVFLHDLLWQQDKSGFLARLDQFLDIAQQRQIGVMLVLFDSCWFPFPYLGHQRAPEPGVHNSFWVQSPGVTLLRDPERFQRLSDYVTGVISHFRQDARVQMWDIWNEPDNGNGNSYGPRDLGEEKGVVVLPLLEQAFAWARSVQPSQPLTSGLWRGDMSSLEKMSPINRLQALASDILSFHCYGSLTEMQSRVAELRQYGRPLVCTEYMSRGTGSTFAAITPYLKQQKVSAYNWGFCDGKSQTKYAWDTWQNPCIGEPELWFHDILHNDGVPYRQEEVDVLARLTGKSTYRPA